MIPAGDGIARISGFPQVRLDDLLLFEGGGMGFALALEEDAISAVLVEDAAAVEAGHEVRGTGEVLRTLVGDGLLGRVDPLGRPLDGGAPPQGPLQPIERADPAIIDRAPITEQVETGGRAIDALFTLGRGQRELLIGDRATGKTSLAVDAIVAQKRSDVICIYVAIRQRATAVRRAIDAVRRHGRARAVHLRRGLRRRARRPAMGGALRGHGHGRGGAGP